MTIVSGKSRVAVPPARTMPFIARAAVAVAARIAQRRRALTAWASARCGGGRDGVQARLLALGQRPPPVGVQSIGCSLDRRQAALVVEDDEHVLELVEVGGRLQVGGLDDRVRVAPDVDDLADQQALGIRRADAAARARCRPSRPRRRARSVSVESICSMTSDAAELADDLAGRGARRQLADDGRAAGR